MHNLFHGAAIRGSVYERIKQREKAEKIDIAVRDNQVAPIAREIVMPADARCDYCANLAVSRCDYSMGGFEGCGRFFCREHGHPHFAFIDRLVEQLSADE